MSSRLRWMPDWLTGPSLGQYMKVRPGDKTKPAGATQPDGEDLGSTKQILKEHMVDSFFERALHQIDPEMVDNGEIDASISYEAGAIVEPLHDVVDHEPIYEAELPLDESFLVIDGDSRDETESLVIRALPGEEPADQRASIEEEAPPIGYYVFAITLGQIEFQLPSMSIEADYPLFVFPFGDAQAVISEVPLSVYSEEALQARLNDPAWFEATLRKHTTILSKIQKQASIVPMRVCTICDSTQGLEAFLKEHHDDFVSTLELIDENHAWRFSIYCNEPRLRTLTAKASNRVRAIQAEMAGKSALEAQPFQEKLEAVLEEEARSVCKACVKHSHGTLSSFSGKNLIHSISEGQAGDAQKREIFRCDYLVSVSNTTKFEQEILSLTAAYRSLGFELGVKGPNTPAQFAGRKVLPAGKRAQRDTTKPFAVNMTGS